MGEDLLWEEEEEEEEEEDLCIGLNHWLALVDSFPRVPHSAFGWTLHVGVVSGLEDGEGDIVYIIDQAAEIPVITKSFGEHRLAVSTLLSWSDPLDLFLARGIRRSVLRITAPHVSF
jgi:hypothetical protein